jgi:hypothetical protein
LRAMTFGCVLPVPSRKKALSGPGAAYGAYPAEFYVVEDSIDVNYRLPPRA